MITLERFVRPVMEIKKGEWLKAILSSLYFYLTITAYYILKPARNSLYIDYLGADNIPYATIFIAVVSFFVILPYTRFAKKIDSDKLVTYFLLSSIAMLLFFRWAFHVDFSRTFSAVISFIFYVWLTLFNSVLVMQFWVLVNDIFDAQAAKRLYGFIGTGGILGGITGSRIAQYAKSLGTENLLLVAIGYIILMIVVYNIIWYREKNNVVATHMETGATKRPSHKEAFDIFKKSKYLLLVMAVVGLVKFVTVQTEWQLNKFVDISLHSRDEMTTFFGSIFEYLNYAALTVQLIFTSRILKRFGFNRALLPLPLGLTLGSTLILLFPVLWAAAILKISEGSLRYSINQSAQNYLFLPISREVRLKIKPFIDVVVYQFAKGFGGILQIFYIFMTRDIFKVSDLDQASLMSYFNLFFLIGWFWVIGALKRTYPSEIRHFLKLHRKDLQTPQSRYKRMATEFLEHPACDSRSMYSDIVSPEGVKSLNVRLAVCVAIYESGGDKEGLRELITEIVRYDRKESVADETTTQSSVADLLSMLEGKKNVNERYDTIKTLNKMRDKNEELDVDEGTIKNAIEKEIDDYYKSFSIFELYESLAKKNGDKEKNDFLKITLRNVFEHSVERIFRLLGLISSPIDMCAIYEGLVDERMHIRANALELLEQTIDKSIHKKLMPLLDGELSVFGPERAGYLTAKMTTSSIKALRAALHSEDPWLCLCSLFIITKFKIEELYKEVEKLSNSEEDLRRATARYLQNRIQMDKTKC